MGVDIETYRGRIGTFKFLIGFDVVTIKCIINFSGSMKVVGSVCFIGLLLLIAGIESNPGPTDMEREALGEDRRKIFVTGIPQEVDKEFLHLFFKNPKKQGGGKICHINFDEEKRSAEIIFEEESAVQIILQKRPIKMKEYVVDITPVQEDVSSVCSESTIEVTGIQMDDSVKELLELYFDDEESSGGEDVIDISIVEGGKALVTFASAEDGDVPRSTSYEVYISQLVRFSSACKNVEDFSESNVCTTEKLLKQGYLYHKLRETFLAQRVIDRKNHTLQNKPLMVLPHQELDKYVTCYDSSTESMEISSAQLNTMNKDEFPGISVDAVQIKIKETVDKPGVNTHDLLPATMATINTQHLSPGAMATLTTQDLLPDAMATVNTKDMFSGETKTENTQDLLSDEGKNVNTKDMLSGATKTENTQDLLPDGGTNVNTKDMLSGATKTENTQDLLPDTMTKVNTKDLLHGAITRKEGQEKSTEDENNTADVMDTAFDDEHTPVTFCGILHYLGLTDKYPGKITLQEVMSIYLDEGNSHCSRNEKLPWVMLKQIIAVQSKARDFTDSRESTETNEKASFAGGEDIFDTSQTAENASDTGLSPFDIFLVTLQSCDPMLKQLVFQKLYLCKIALPFVQCDRLSHEWSVVCWPFRSLVVESKIADCRATETELLELPVKTVTFANFDRPQFSKSKVLNEELSDEIHDTFFNIDCPGGMSERHVSNGTVEMFTKPSIVCQRDKYEGAVTFFNMRGDMKEHFPDQVIEFMSKMTDVLVLFLDKKHLESRNETLLKRLTSFSRLVFMVTSPYDKSTFTHIREFLNFFPSNVRIKVLFCYTNFVPLSPKEIVQKLDKILIEFFTSVEDNSLEHRVRKSETLLSDENDSECVKGKEEACKIVELIKSVGKENAWKKMITPVHYIHAKFLGESIKKLYRLKDVKETGIIEHEIKTIRVKQLQNISEPIKLFIKFVNNGNGFKKDKMFMFRWLSVFLDRRTRQMLPELILQNEIHRNELEDLRNNAPANSQNIENKEKLVESSQEFIEDATLGIEHLFREIGHIYDAVIALNKDTEELDLPNAESMINATAQLVTKGYTFELIDGDNFYFPSHWVQSILQHISSIINHKPVLTMSVLGIQSSGKSTLLNSMFGSQFPVKSGRCTRGIHMQLLPTLSTGNRPFHYVAIIDSEGLRAARSLRKQNNDNELSTVVTGLGDITLLNIMGENTSEIQDIIQVVVHAFLRLKLVNKNLDISKHFYLVHQNVMDVTARDNMRTELHALMETLDGATKDAAEIEGIRDMKRFRQVIEFDITSDVWYFPNFWQGNPPMARVNSDYSHRISYFKLKCLKQAFDCKGKSHKSLCDIALITQDLWKGVLTENFVYRFRNSLEIKAYIHLEIELKETLINFENSIEKEHATYSQKLFSQCSEFDKLKDVTNDIIQRMKRGLMEKEAAAIDRMKAFFDDNEYKDTILQWREFAIRRVKFLGSELEDRIQTETMRLRDLTGFDLRIRECSLRHEKELYERCLKIAKDIKGACLNMEDIEGKFEETWKEISKDILTSVALHTTSDSLFESFLKCFFDIFDTEKLILKSELERRGLYQSSPHKHFDTGINTASVFSCGKLHGSFLSSGIEIEDTNIPSEMFDKETMSQRSQVENVVETFFQTTESVIHKFMVKNEEITYREVRLFLQKLYKRITDMHQQSNISLKISGIVKLFVHISCYAQKHFEENNDRYQREKGVPARLEKYKRQVKQQFISYLNSRKAEEVAANHITLIVEHVLSNKINERLLLDIKATLMHHLPHLKFHLILEMMEDLANKDDFESFISYVQKPRKFAKQWMKKVSEEYLFGSSSVRYNQLASSVVDEFYDEVKVSVRKCAPSDETESVTIEKWVECFTSSFSNFSISSSEFRDVVKTLKQIEDVKNFNDHLIECLIASSEKLKSDFISIDREFINCRGHKDAFKVLFRKAWGCPEQCAFCGEPCAKGFQDHTGTNHYSLQHRISCCSGTREDYTNKAALSSCNFNIQSLQQHHCDHFGFRCNQGIKIPCRQVWHEFSQYKVYLPDWDIEPNSNMQDCSMFWMWFVAKYKFQLAIHYKFDISDIPDTWDEISKEDAFANLGRIYKIQ